MLIASPNKPAQIISEIIYPKDLFPNNNHYPLLIYKSVFNIDNLAANAIKVLMQQNGWGNTWVNGIYSYHHYHSNTHEVLVSIAGWCEVKYGGPEGRIYKLEQGDVVIHPAGVSHKKVKSSENFACIGAYPDSSQYDMCFGKEEEHPTADLTIQKVGVPKKDPIFGHQGPIFQHWNNNLI